MAAEAIPPISPFVTMTPSPDDIYYGERESTSHPGYNNASTESYTSRNRNGVEDRRQRLNPPSRVGVKSVKREGDEQDGPTQLRQNVRRNKEETSKSPVIAEGGSIMCKSERATAGLEYVKSAKEEPALEAKEETRSGRDVNPPSRARLLVEK